MNDDMKPAPAPPFARGSWQHAVDDALVGYLRTSQEFATPHEAVAWLLKTTANAAIACAAAPAPQEPVAPLDKETAGYKEASKEAAPQEPHVEADTCLACGEGKTHTYITPRQHEGRFFALMLLRCDNCGIELAGQKELDFNAHRYPFALEQQQ